MSITKLKQVNSKRVWIFVVNLEEGPPEKATRTLSVGEIIAFDVTASRNFPNKLLLKQSAQKRPSSIPP